MLNTDKEEIFPPIEDLYDLDLDALKDLKIKIEIGKVKGYQREDEDDMTNEEMLNFVNGEINERNMMNDVISFFLNSESTRIDNKDNDIIDKYFSNKDINNIPLIEDKVIKNSESFRSISNDKSSTTTYTKKNDSKSYNLFNKLSNTQIPFSNNIHNTKEKLGDLLNRTKVNSDQFQYMVGNSLFQKNSWVPLAKEYNKRKIPPIKIEHKKERKVFPSSVDSRIIINVQEKKIKRRKKNKKMSEKFDYNQPSSLEIRKNYVVPDITAFIKKSHSKEKIENNQNKEISKKIEEDKPESEVISKIYQHTSTSNDNNRPNEDTNKVNSESNIKQIQIDKDDKKDTYTQINVSNKIEIQLDKQIDEKRDNNSFKIESQSIEFTKGKKPLSHIDKSVSCVNSEEIKTNTFIPTSSTKQKYYQINNEEIMTITPRNKYNDMQLSKNVEEYKCSPQNKNMDLNTQDTQLIKENFDNKKNKRIFDEEKKSISESKEKTILEESEEYEDAEAYDEIPNNNNNIKTYHKDNTFSNDILPSLNINQIYNSTNENNSFNINNESKSVPKKNSRLNRKLTKIKHINFPHKENEFNKSKTNQLEFKFQRDNIDSIQHKHPLNNFSATQHKKPQSAFKREQYLNISDKLKNRPQSGKLSSLSNRLLISGTYQIRDYSKLYQNFFELFNGYFLSSTYSQAKQFNFEGTISSLYESFKQLHKYEMQSNLIDEKDKLYTDIIKAEAGVIHNRLQKVSEKLLNEEDCITSPEKYYMLKKVLELEKKNYSERKRDDEGNETIQTKLFFRVVLSRPEIYDIVCYILGIKEQWCELPHGLSLGYCWNLLWTYAPPNINFTQIFSFQKVNHLINNRTIHRKDMLKKHIYRIRNMNKRLNALFDIIPQTFLLTKEYMAFIEEFHRIGKDDPLNLWIVKPIGKSRGRGIFLIDDITNVPLDDTYLVQKYLTNPLLLEGYKFDMRLYVLVTSVNPLEMFLYKDGFARVSNEKFDLFTKNTKVHLTNAAIQNGISKKSSNYEKVYGGSKIGLEVLKYKLNKLYGIDFNKVIWPQVRSIVLKTLIACQNDIPYAPSCFEMFGFDVIIDQNMKCWLLEFNSSPSLERSNVLDDQVKLELVNDIFNIVDPVNINREALIKVLERVMKIKHNVNNRDVYLYSPSVQLNMDLTQIFQGKVPRAFGEVPEKIGKFEVIAPTKESDRLIKMTGNQKMFGGKRDKK